MSGILVAGGAGFIGSHLVEQSGGEVFDLRTGQDARNMDQVKNAVKGKDIVYHLANMPAHRLSIDNPHTIMENNYIATLNFAEACRLHDVPLVFASSFGVYGNNQKLPFREDAVLHPDTPYGVAKKSSEELLKIYHDLYGMTIAIVRPSNIWGERDYLHEPLQVLPLWMKAANEGKPLIVYGEHTTRDFTHISDFLAGIRKAADCKGFDIFNIAAGKEIRLLEIAQSISGTIDVRPLPKTEVERWEGDIAKARNILGWEPKKDFWKEFALYKERALR